MSKAKVTFHMLIQDTQDPGADPNRKHMTSRAFFTLEHAGKTYADMSVGLRQPFGTDYVTGPIEIEKASGSHRGNWNHNDFRDAVDDYYRSAIRTGGGGAVRTRNNTFVFSKNYEIDILDR
jgi:hypothetical protein